MVIRKRQFHIVAWGSYDRSKPRARLLLDELQSRGALAARINIPIWESVRVGGTARSSDGRGVHQFLSEVG